jgi:hypothetical protein
MDAAPVDPARIRQFTVGTGGTPRLRRSMRFGSEVRGMWSRSASSWRQAATGGGSARGRRVVQDRLESCHDCHLSGLILAVPALKTTVAPERGERTTSMVLRIRSLRHRAISTLKAASIRPADVQPHERGR